MARLNELYARLVDLFGPLGAANPDALYGNLTVSPNGNILVGSIADNHVQKLQVTGNAFASGYVARAAQVAFSLTQSTYGTYNFAANQTVTMGAQNTWGGVTMWTNVGSCFNTATGVFTAPVAGAYFFNASLTSVGGDCIIGLLKNSASVGYTPLSYSVVAGSYFGTQTNTWVISLAAGDTVSCYMGTNNGTTAIPYGNSFCGYLL